MAAVDLSQVNLFDADFHAVQDPHTVWAVMRERAPLHRQELPDGRSFWSVTRYHDACRVLGNHREFTSERGSLLNQLGHAEAASGKMLVATDPPRHGELRRPLNKLFTGRGLVRSEDRSGKRCGPCSPRRSTAASGISRSEPPCCPWPWPGR